MKSLLALTSRDTLADEKLDRACNVVNDNQSWPATGIMDMEGETVIVVDNWDRIFGMQVCGLIQEVLELMQEALKLWAARRQEEQAGQFIAIIQSLMKNIMFVDRSLNTYLAAVSNFCRERTLLARAVDDPSTDSGDIDLKAYAKLDKAVELFAVDDAPWKACLQVCSTFIGGIPDTIANDHALELREIKVAIDQMIYHVDCRDQMFVLFETLSEVLVFQGPDCAIDIWLQQTMQQNEQSCLAQAISVVTSIKDMQALDEKTGLEFVRITDVENDEKGGLAGLVASEARVYFLVNFVDQRAFWVNASLQEAHDLRPEMMHDPLVEHESTFLVSCIQAAASKHFMVHEFENILPGPWPPLSETDDLWDVLDKFQTLTLTQERSISVGKAVIMTGTWDCDNLVGLVSSVANLLPPGIFKIVYTHNMSSEADTTEIMYECESVKDFTTLANLWGAMHKVATLFAFLKRRFSGGMLATKTFDDRVLKDGDVRPELAATIQSLYRFIDTGLTYSQAAVDSSLSGIFRSPFPCVEDSTAFFQAALSATALVSKDVFSFLVSNTLEASAAIPDLAPRYDHIVNDKVMIKGLAKKHVLSSPNRELLTAKLDETFTLISMLSKYHAEWRLGVGKLKDNPMYAEAMEVVSTNYNLGMKTSAVISCLSCLLEFEGQARIDRANVCKSTQRSLVPLMLRNEIDKFATK